MPSSSISIVLPNYNGRGLLERNLPSILKSAEGFSDSEVIVVDDASQDDSVAFLQQHYPQVRVLVNEVNRGFSATCNRGIFAARHSLVCVTNTDVTFTEEYLQRTADHFRDPRLFAVKGDIINYRNDFADVLTVERSSLLYYRRGFLRFDNKVSPDPGQFGSGVGKQFVLLGCCFVADRAKLTELGGFNEIFSPYYWEDSDLALRALEAGYTLHYAPDCVVYHQLSSTINATQPPLKKSLIGYRNKFLFMWLHGSHYGLRRDHALFLLLSLLTRWLILDWKYYAALVMAWLRYRSFTPASATSEPREH